MFKKGLEMKAHAIHYTRRDGTMEFCPRCDALGEVKKSLEENGAEWVNVPCAEHAKIKPVVLVGPNYIQQWLDLQK